ncbi:MAG: hypothetical protein ABI857_11785, partial [Acidobacteriota bacterium]
MTEKHPSDHPTSRLAQAIVVFVCVIPMIATIVFGAVDSWTIGLLSILVSIIALLWLVDAGVSGELRYGTSKLQLPIIALIAIGFVQLLPFGPGDIAELLNAPVVQTLSMDPYAT